MQPVEIYVFMNGDGDVLGRFTSADVPVTRDGELYVPVALSRGPVKGRGDLDQEVASIAMAMAEASSMALLSLHGSLQRVILQVFAADISLAVPVWRATFSGVVLSASLSGNDEVTFSVESSGGSLKRNAFRQAYSLTCPLRLYGAGPGQCNASRAAATTTLSVALGTGPVLALAPTWVGTRAPADFLGGSASWLDAEGRTVRRNIVEAGPTSLRLSASWPLQTGSTTIEIVLGCDKSLAACGGRHNNVQNFGGCPFMPTVNPTGVRNNFV